MIRRKRLLQLAVVMLSLIAWLAISSAPNAPFTVELFTLLGRGKVSQVAWSPDGEMLITAGSTGIHLYDAPSLQELRFITTGTRVTAIAISPDELTFVSGDESGEVQLWSIETGQLLRNFIGHTDKINSVGFSPDGKEIVSGGDDWTARVWNKNTGQLLNSFQTRWGQVFCVALNSAGVLAAGAENFSEFVPEEYTDNGLWMWNIRSGQPVNALPGDKVYSLAYSPDERILASGTVNTVDIWDTSTWKRKHILWTVGNYGVSSVSFSPDGRTLAAGSDGSIFFWDVESGRLRLMLKGRGYGSFVAFSPDGSLLASGSDDGTVRLWHVTWR